MIVLDMLPYDAILGYDWLMTFSPMQCDWQAKTMQFQHHGRSVVLKGLQSLALEVSSMTAKQVYKCTKGNDVWAFVILDTAIPKELAISEPQPKEDDLKHLPLQYADVF
jgi:hypothetical protein